MMRIERGYGDTGINSALGVLAAESRLLVCGPAGSGRSTLLAAIAAHDGARRRVWWCRGHRVGRPSGETVLRDGTIDAVLDAAAQERTTVLVDDAALLAPDVLERILALVERRAELDLRIAASHRPAPATPELAAVDSALIGAHGALHLGPLTFDGIAAWLAECSAELDPSEILRRTGGWPELVALAIRDTSAATDVLASRLAMLEPEHRRALESACFGVPPGGGLLEAAAVGLVHDDHGPAPIVAEVVRAAAPPAERASIARVAITMPRAAVVEVASNLLTLGDRSADAGRLFEQAADDVRAEDPALASRLYDAAADAGRPDHALLGRRAGTALAEGRLGDAVALAGAASDEDAEPRAVGAVWAHAGRPDLAGDWYARAGCALAVAPLVASGRVDKARAAVASAPGGDATRVFASGVLAVAAGDVDRALVLLERGARMAEARETVPDWPDTPHALGALVAADWLDTERAGTFAQRATDGAVGGAPFADRHRLVAAWAALRAGRLGDADADVDPAPDGRDALLAASLRGALAMRTGDTAELRDIHRTARATVQHAKPEPFALSPATELAHLAARVGGDTSYILGPLDALVSQLGDPPALRVQLAWAHVLVALARDDAASARRAADRLQALADHSAITADPTAGPTTRLLADAAAAFADVLAGTVDAAAVRVIADRLVERGLVFEASRLTGGAGVRATDPATARELLGDVRRLRATQVRGGTGERPRPVVELSAREREVARAVLDGLTHREIGAQLFISPKTVEHHVARIRQKLGAGTRAELLAAIRTELARTS